MTPRPQGSVSFLSGLACGDVGKLVSKHVFWDTPFLFGGDADLCANWKTKVAESLEVDPAAIHIVGSAAVGVSLNPSRQLEPFDEWSDVDVAVVSGRHFDLSWHVLRSLGSRFASLSYKDREAVRDHMSRLIYYGTIATDKIIKLLPFSATWLKAAGDMSDIAPTLDRDIKFRIYKDVDSLRAYQSLSFESARSCLN